MLTPLLALVKGLTYELMPRFKCVVVRTDADAVPEQDASQGAAMADAEGALREAGPETCACWVGGSGTRFATGHQNGDVLLWQLPSCVLGKREKEWVSQRACLRDGVG